jgi:Flp pilus assembly protein TadB
MAAMTLSTRVDLQMGSKSGLGGDMGVLKGIGGLLIVVWVVLWLFVKITFAAIHLLLLIGLALLVFGFIKRETAGPKV